VSAALPSLTRDDVARAVSIVGAHLPPTPLRRSFALRPREVYLKLECWQPTGSFKVRGALHFVAGLTAEERARGIVAASAGNHALGVAFAAAALGRGVSARLYVPSTAPRAKVDKLRTFPVEVVEGGATYDEAYAAAVEDVARTGATLVHAYDDPRTATGQGTVAAEVCDALPEVGTVVVPCGGGGLLAAMAVYLKAEAPTVRIVAVQPDASPSLRESLRLGAPLHEYACEPTIADGIAGGIGDLIFAHRALIDEVVEVSEDELEGAIGALLAEDQVVAEGAGAASVAALMSGRVEVRDGRPAVAVVTGGNVDAAVLARALARRR
jgi:threonine dehydratase